MVLSICYNNNCLQARYLFRKLITSVCFLFKYYYALLHPAVFSALLLFSYSALFCTINWLQQFFLSMKNKCMGQFICSFKFVHYKFLRAQTCHSMLIWSNIKESPAAMKSGSECYVLIYYYREGRNEIIWNEFSLPRYIFILYKINYKRVCEKLHSRLQSKTITYNLVHFDHFIANKSRKS